MMIHKRKKNRTKLLAAGFALGALLGVRAVSRLASRYDFGDRNVLITGGSRGLGLLLARELVREGARVILLARNPEELQKAQVDLDHIRPGHTYTFLCDVSRAEDIDHVLKDIQYSMGAIDVLINNAGIIQVGPCEEMQLKDFEEAMAVHFWGPLNFMLSLIPEMLKQGCGRIINIASFGGRVAVPHLAPYCASKFALVGISDALRAELASRDIKITTVCPGLMRTGSHINASFKGRNQEEFAWFAVSAAMPLISMSGARAARKILNASRYGSPSLDLGISARAVTIANAVAPSLVGRIMAIVNDLLPQPLGESTEAHSGWQSRSRWAPSKLTKLADREIPKNNQMKDSASGR